MEQVHGPATAPPPDPAATAPAPRRYALVAPSRDEAATLPVTLDSILAQTVPPTRLVVVDDGSGDATPAILESYRARMPCLSVVRRDRGGTRQVGGGVVLAFEAGLATLDDPDLEFICKIDTDLDLPPRYFEGLIALMDADPELAVVSGKPYFRDPRTGTLVSEFCGDETAVGMTKFYRLSRFREVGGFVRHVGWDVIDCHTCRMHGLKASSVERDDLRFVHLRPMGSSHISLWHGRMRHGLGAWYLGTTPVYMLASVLFRLPKHPVVVGAAGMAWGYLKAWLGGAPRHDAPGYLAFVRGFQLRALVMGKARAAEAMRLRAKAARLGAG